MKGPGVAWAMSLSAYRTHTYERHPSTRVTLRNGPWPASTLNTFLAGRSSTPLAIYVAYRSFIPTEQYVFIDDTRWHVYLDQVQTHGIILSW